MARAQAPAGGRVFGTEDAAPAAPQAAPRELVRLEYRAPAGCPSEAGLRDAFAARMGYDPVAASAPRLLRVAIVHGPGGYEASAELRDVGGRIVWSRPPLADADCRALVDVLALGAKFAIDPASVGAEQAPQPPQPPPIVMLSPAPAPAQPRHDRPPPPAPEPPSERPRVRLGFRAGGAIGSAPAPTGTFSGDIGVGWTYFSIALEGRGDIPVTGAVNNGVQLRTNVAAASLVPCGHYWLFFGCGVVSVGDFWATATNALHPATGSAVYAAAGARGGIEWALPPAPSVALRVSVDVLFTVHPITAAVDATHVWSAPPFSGLLGGGLVVKL